MQVKAVHKNARMAPRKIRPVAALVRGMSAQTAIEQLQFMPGKAPKVLLDVLKSAMANAAHNHELKADTLVVSKAYVDEGIVMKRYQPASRGMAHAINKRLSHVTIVVDGEKAVKSGKKKAAKKKPDITTISPDEYVSQEAERKQEEEKEQQAQEAAQVADQEKPATDEPRPVDKRRDKETGEAYQKTKIQQQGGDKKKTHRRKSIG